MVPLGAPLISDGRQPCPANKEALVSDAVKAQHEMAADLPDALLRSGTRLPTSTSAWLLDLLR